MTRKPLDDRTLSILGVLCILLVLAAIVAGALSSRYRVAKTQQQMTSLETSPRLSPASLT